MSYDIEASKRESAELKKVFGELFPLVDERDLPSAPCHIKPFLQDRVKKAVDEGTRHFTSRVVRILCEVSPPKTHVEDMARIVVERAQQAEHMNERLRELVPVKPQEAPLAAVAHELKRLKDIADAPFAPPEVIELLKTIVSRQGCTGPMLQEAEELLKGLSGNRLRQG